MITTTQTRQLIAAVLFWCKRIYFFNSSTFRLPQNFLNDRCDQNFIELRLFITFRPLVFGVYDLCVCRFIIYHSNTSVRMCTLRYKAPLKNHRIYLAHPIFRFCSSFSFFSIYIFCARLDGVCYCICADIDIYFGWSMVCNMLSTSVCIDKWTCLDVYWIHMGRSAAFRYVSMKHSSLCTV